MAIDRACDVSSVRFGIFLEFSKNNKPQCASTHHSRTYTHVDKHIVYGYRNSVPRFIKRPV